MDVLSLVGKTPRQIIAAKHTMSEEDLRAVVFYRDSSYNELIVFGALAVTVALAQEYPDSKIAHYEWCYLDHFDPRMPSQRADARDPQYGLREGYVVLVRGTP